MNSFRQKANLVKNMQKVFLSSKKSQFSRAGHETGSATHHDYTEGGDNSK